MYTRDVKLSFPNNSIKKFTLGIFTLYVTLLTNFQESDPYIGIHRYYRQNVDSRRLETVLVGFFSCIHQSAQVYLVTQPVAGPGSHDSRRFRTQRVSKQRSALLVLIQRVPKHGSALLVLTHRIPKQGQLY